jgi:ribonuclease HII
MIFDCSFERAHWKNGIRCVAGIDEAGRGPLAGPVVAAAVIFPVEVWIQGVDDSKKLSPRRREELYSVIRSASLSVGIGIVSHEVIDRINIYRATMQAMAEAVARLEPAAEYLLVDGPRYEASAPPHTAIIDGDARCHAIAAASIIAKVTRDRLMADFDREFPGYGFAKHKGYGTQEHMDALRKFGPCGIHRLSFRLPAQGL